MLVVTQNQFSVAWVILGLVQQPDQYPCFPNIKRSGQAVIHIISCYNLLETHPRQKQTATREVRIQSSNFRETDRDRLVKEMSYSDGVGCLLSGRVGGSYLWVVRHL